MTKPIEFYFDFASPYGFLAAMQIDVLLRPVTWRPFLLGAVYKTFGQSPLDHPLKRDYVIKVNAPRMARRVDLELKVPSGFPEHASPPSRVFYWIDQQDPTGAAKHPKSFVCLDDADHLLLQRRDAAYVAEVIAAWASRYLPPEAERSVAASDDTRVGALRRKRSARGAGHSGFPAERRGRSRR